MIYFSDEAILNGLREKRSDCIRFLYREYFPLAKSFVMKNSGSYEDAEDVFQDGMVVLYKKSHLAELKLKCSLKTFFYSICRNIWMQLLDRKWRLLYSDDMVNETPGDYEVLDFDTDEARLERSRLLQLHFLSIPADCQEILRLFIRRIPFRDIAQKLGIRDESYVKTRKYLCKNMLRKRILKDPKCQNLFFNE